MTFRKLLPLDGVTDDTWLLQTENSMTGVVLVMLFYAGSAAALIQFVPAG